MTKKTKCHIDIIEKYIKYYIKLLYIILKKKILYNIIKKIIKNI